MYIKATYTLNIFIAYHPDDRSKFEELYQHLRELDGQNETYQVNKIWYSKAKLESSDYEQLAEMMEAADLLLLLLSEASILSPLFSGRNLQTALALHRKEKTLVVPIILTTCWWEDTAYRELAVLPRAGLPIYDSEDVKNELFDQLVQDLNQKLQKVRQQKFDLEDTFKDLLEEADALFANWEQQPERLRSALPLYKDAVEHWREGFVPHRELLEAKIDRCHREIDFRHYARAAREAWQQKRYQDAYFNCKDALQLRKDAEMEGLFKQVNQLLQAEELAVKKAPFDKHIKAAQSLFLELQWGQAKEEFRKALDFYEEDFKPSKAVILHKIEICRREAIWQESEQLAEQSYRAQRYAESVELLLSGVREMHAEAFEKIDRMLNLVKLLENVSRFQDPKSKRWGFYNKKDETVIIAPKYLAAYDFSENLAAVKKWDKWGFIDVEGNEVIPFVYDFVGHFRNGRTEVWQAKENFFINHLGERVDESGKKLLRTKDPI